MQRRRVTLIVGALIVTAGCAPQGPPTAVAAHEDLLLLRSGTGVAITSTNATTPTFKARDAIPSQDWSTVVIPTVQRRTTRLVAKDPLSGRALWKRRLNSQLKVKVVSGTGDRVALSPIAEPYYKQGRARTDIVVVSAGGSATRRISLRGNYEPEAFSADRETLFVIQYLPAKKPNSYRVRSLDLASGRATGVYTVDKELQEAMKGTARVQTMPPDGQRLYTMYTLRTHDELHAFVHVLDLKGKWAHCIDLPPGFAEKADSATALTTSADGTRLYVANSATGKLAEVDTGKLKVLKTEELEFALGSGTDIAQVGDSLYLAGGRRLTSLDPATMVERGTWLLEESVRGFQLGEDGTRLYVGQAQKVIVMDAATGAKLDEIDPAGIGNIDILGRATRSIDSLRSQFVCAC
jgi:hypothetical protein